MIYLLSLIIPILSFLFQSYPRFFNKYFGVDLWMRMMEADLVRTNNHRIPMGKIKRNFIFEGYFTAPPIFPWLLSFIPKKTLFRYQGFIAPIFDVIQNIIVFVITYNFTGRYDTALVSQIIYATMPIAVLENSYLTPRAFGYLNFTLAFYPILYYSLYPNFWYLLTGFAFTILIFFTHRFAVQSLLFVGIFFSIIDHSLLFLTVFFASLIIAIVFSQGFYIRILKGHLAIIRFWIRNYEFRFAHQVRGLSKRNRADDFLSFVNYMLKTFTPFTLVGTNLWLIIPFTYFTNHLFKLSYIPYLDPIFLKMTLSIVFFYFLSILVLSIKYLIPIGEGQRYLEMALAQTAIVSSIVLMSLLNTQHRTLSLIIFITILIVNILLTVLSQLKGVIKDKTRSLSNDTKKVFKFLNKMKPTPRIMCIPHYMAPMFTYNTRVFVLMDIAIGSIEKTIDIYPVLRRSVNDFAREFNLNILVLNKLYASKDELKLTRNKILFETEDFQLLKI